MNIPIPKLKAIILYFCNHTDRRFLGKTKLMKLFYFLDFTHLKNYGTPVTYDNYVHLEHGPIPSVIKNLVDTVANDIDDSLLADTIIIEKNGENGIQRITPCRQFTKNDEKYFSETELMVMQNVCDRFGNKNTKDIEDASHEEAPWKKTNLLDEIPYFLAAEDSDCKMSKEELQLLNVLA
jgi:uncharacterized phage-associated protein